MFCPECGVDHHAEDREERTAVDREVEIARINAKRDVDVARISARLERDTLETVEEVAEIEADALVESTVAEAEIIGAAIEGSDLPPTDPIEFIAPSMVTDVDIDNELEDAPPETDGSPVPAEPHKKGLGMWG